jgi:hypothetical protein
MIAETVQSPDFGAAMVVDIRFQQLLAEKAQSTLASISVPQSMPMAMPTPSPLPTPTSMTIPLPSPAPIPPGVSTESPQSQATLPYPLLFPQPQVAEPLTLASSHQSVGSGSSSVRFVLVTSMSFLLMLTSSLRPVAVFGHKSSLDETPS